MSTSTLTAQKDDLEELKHINIFSLEWKEIEYVETEKWHELIST